MGPPAATIAPRASLAGTFTHLSMAVFVWRSVKDRPAAPCLSKKHTTEHPTTFFALSRQGLTHTHIFSTSGIFLHTSSTDCPLREKPFPPHTRIPFTRSIFTRNFVTHNFVTRKPVTHNLDILICHTHTHATLSHTTFEIIDPPPCPLFFLPSLYRFNRCFWLLEEVDLWGYPDL